MALGHGDPVYMMMISCWSLTFENLVAPKGAVLVLRRIDNPTRRTGDQTLRAAICPLSAGQLTPADAFGGGDDKLPPTPLMRSPADL